MKISYYLIKIHVENNCFVECKDEKNLVIFLFLSIWDEFYLDVSKFELVHTTSTLNHSKLQNYIVHEYKIYIKFEIK